VSEEWVEQVMISLVDAQERCFRLSRRFVFVVLQGEFLPLGSRARIRIWDLGFGTGVLCMSDSTLYLLVIPCNVKQCHFARICVWMCEVNWVLLHICMFMETP
jgi:hypothetical protein